MNVHSTEASGGGRILQQAVCSESKVDDGKRSSKCVGLVMGDDVADVASKECITLANGVDMPAIGFGCAFGNWTDSSKFMGFQPDLGHFAVAAALRVGYTHLDCAYVYGSHRVVSQHIGQAMSTNKCQRSSLFITTKVCHPVSENALNRIKKTFDFDAIPVQDIKERVLLDFETSLDELGCGYVDLLLMHWPGSFFSSNESDGRIRRQKCWEAIESIYRSGKARAIGVSNFLVRHLETMIEDTEISPMVNQIELSPYIFQSDVVSFCNQKNIKLVAWAPFGSGSTGVLVDPVISQLAVKYTKNPGQIILRWLIQLGCGVLPKSSSESRMASNLDVFDFHIDDEDMKSVASLNRNKSSVFTSDHIA